MKPLPEAVPFFSQWETPDMTLAVLAEGADIALRRDPLWRGSGAETFDEYALWAANICGMACLKMILATRGEIVPTVELARQCTGYGGYVVSEGSIKGLIYAPFVTFVKAEFGLDAEAMTGVATADIPAILTRSRFFIASVSSSIRWPEREPRSKGGHLVLVTSASDQGFRFHNPSGHTSATQANAVLAPSDFDRFFANRGIAVAI
ncbi:C39 family peptidase [Mesorhizobium sp. B4-1-4]|uniref:C39 family peptidase n=1 Tax=Mesorhizobium sp. B4-1-4 TaxID=2589888 RepID=UPI001129E744|nr:C39 family peptidase [Mesorhizobium sp. B4-1-4]UCI34257.1 C39 family peptidase [Mesorhizobium sp. B4-1-4]